jgi:hypothetical protein
VPWSHCEREVGDAEACPACGVTKAQWTVQFNVTREFRVTRRPALRLLVVGPDGERPVAGEPFRVELPGGQVVEGTTDELGTGKVQAPAAGECGVAFPRQGAGAVRLDGQAGPTFRVPAAGRHRFVLELANARWSAARVRFGQVVHLLVDAAEGGDVTFDVLEHDAGGEDDPVATLVAPVRGGVAKATWHVPFVDDADDAPTALDRETGFDLPEFVFVARRGAAVARCDAQLLFSTDLELPIKDLHGRAVADTDYELRCAGQVKRGRTDAQGVLREAGVGPDFEVVLATGARVRVRTTGGAT